MDAIVNAANSSLLGWGGVLVAAVGKAIDDVFCTSAAHMAEVPDRSVALVVTSPPYFAGKEYEEALGEGHVPASYLDYIGMLEDVFFGDPVSDLETAYTTVTRLETNTR